MVNTKTRLNETEKEVLFLLAEGYTSKEISEKLKLKFKYVCGNLKINMCKKLGAYNTCNGIAIAFRKGIIK
jgi:DNA-binding NarL/FixJ family response regulator